MSYAFEPATQAQQDLLYSILPPLERIHIPTMSKEQASEEIARQAGSRHSPAAKLWPTPGQVRFLESWGRCTSNLSRLEASALIRQILEEDENRRNNPPYPY
jgi:hypothetical protein